MFSRIIKLSGSVAILSVIGVILITPVIHALDIPSRPSNIPIVDQTNTLTETQKSQLAKQIADERTLSGNQFAVVIVPSMENDSIEDFSLSVARNWGIGTGENNNGVLLMIAKNDKKLRIEVGAGLEGVLTDVQSGRIIRNDISPQFRQGKYYEGIQLGLTSIIATVRGEYTTTSTAANTIFPWEYILFFGGAVLMWLSSVLGRTKSWWAGGVIGGLAGGVTGLLLGSLAISLVGFVALTLLGLLFDKIVSANYKTHARRGVRPSWWAGGGFLGGGGPRGGSGFGGFGGGGFGGGGASGGW